jgi:hypothetical protein
VPYLTGVFPLGGPVGEPRVVTAEGWDLPKATAVMLPLLKPGVRPVPGPANVLEQVRFATDTLPEVMEQEGGAPQVLAGACIVNGRLDRAGDRDAFQVRLPAGGDFVAEVAARRLGSPVDAQLILTDSRGRVLASNDDCEDKADGLNTHHADARLAAKVPDDGVCRLEIREAQGKGGAAYGYRLTVGPPRPDFEVRVTPSCVNARAGAVVPLTLHVVRRDGFAGPVTVRVADGPPGAALDAAVIPAGQTSVRATLSVPDDLQPGVFPLRWEAVARVDGQDVVRPAVPAEDMLQAFFNRHLVPVREGLLSVTAPRWGRPGGVAADRRSALASVHPAEPGPVRLVPGGTTTVRLTSPRMTAPEGVHLTLQEPPDGVSLATVAWRERACEVVLRAEADKAKPGLSGNLIFEVTSDRVPRDRDGKPGKGARQRVSIGVLPAVPFELAQGGRAESGN